MEKAFSSVQLSRDKVETGGANKRGRRSACIYVTKKGSAEVAKPTPKA